jgi:hypothetical protein
MDKELKILLDNSKLDQLYKNNLFSIKSICELLGTWGEYSPEEKFKLENITLRDSKINRNFTYKGTYENKYTYGEVIRKGVDTIIDKINKYKKPTDKDVFIDIGSGIGKLVLHLAIKTDIKTLVGVELVKERVSYAKHIQQQVLPDKSVFFIEKDIRDFDLSIATIVFMNDLCFGVNLINHIIDRLPKGCHFITTQEIPECKILKEEFYVDVSWGKDKFKLYYYIK